MNCEEFQKVIRELAESQPLKSALRETAQQHAADCPACAESLASQVHLSRALAAWRERDGRQQAPARVEAALLLAFQQRSAATVAEMPQRRLVGRSWRWVAAVAAVVAVSGLITFSSSRRVQAPAQVALVQPEPTGSAAAVPAADPEAPKPSPVILARDSQPAARSARRPRPAQTTASAAAMPEAATGNNGNGQTAMAARAPLPRLQEREATAFYPLTPGFMDETEFSQLIRVRMPRGELERVGFILPPDSEAGLVNADILLSGDGTARAIRFLPARR